MTSMDILDLFMNMGIFIIQSIGIYFCLKPKYKLYISITPFIIMSALNTYVIEVLFNYDVSIWIKQSLVFLEYLIYIFLFFKDKPRYKISIVLFSQIALILHDLIVGCIMTMIFGLDRITNDLSTRAITFIFAFVVMAIIYIVFVHLFKRFKKEAVIQHFGMFILFPISQLVLLISCMYGIKFYNDYLRGIITDNKNEIIMWCISVVLSSIASIIADIILYRVQKENSNNKKLKESLELANYRNELELQYYQQMQTNIEETRKIRHDFYNILSTMNDANKISSELKDEIETALRNSSTATLCQNNIVNLIILNKNKTCLENNIKLDTDLDIPEEISISKLDLLRVFSNILDNAIEANSKITDNNNRFIKLNAKIRDNYLFISSKNPFDSELIKNEKHYETTKKQKNLHGFGMTILDDIAKKYNGELITENNENNFTTLISLKIS